MFSHSDTHLRVENDSSIFGSDEVLLRDIHFGLNHQSAQNDTVFQMDSSFNIAPHQYKINFDIQLGSGTSSTVYLGYFHHENKTEQINVAVKKSKVDEVNLLSKEHEILKAISKKINEVGKEYSEIYKKNNISHCIIKYYGSNIYHSLYELSKVELIMEYANSGTLGDWIYPHCMSQIRRPFSWNLAYNILIHIMRALDFLHNIVKLIHCDLKAHNILLNDEPCGLQAKLGDFGSCQSVDNAEFTFGTLLYYAPEVLNGKQQTPESDIFSYGCIVAEMANQKVLYTNTERCFANATMVKLYVDTQGLRDTIRSGTPKKINDLYFWCTKANPQDRPNCQKILEELDEGSKLILS